MFVTGFLSVVPDAGLLEPFGVALVLALVPEFALELVDKATDLETVCGQKVDRQVLLEQIVECFEGYYNEFMKQGDLRSLQTEYNRLLVNRGREVCVLDPQGEFRGVATGITDKGELCVELPDGSVTRVYAGEVSVRGLYGYV